MSSRLYKLALWYIKKCNTKWANQYKEKVESLNRLTYWAFSKYMLNYGADAEWQFFDRYEVLDNAIQRLGEYENIGTVEEFKALKKNQYKHENCANIRQQAIDDFLTEICKMIVQSESNGNYRFYACEIKQSIADLAKQLKEQSK